VDFCELNTSSSASAFRTASHAFKTTASLNSALPLTFRKFCVESSDPFNRRMCICVLQTTRGVLGVRLGLRGSPQASYNAAGEAIDELVTGFQEEQAKGVAVDKQIHAPSLEACPACKAVCTVFLNGRLHCNRCGTDSDPLPFEIQRGGTRRDFLAGNLSGTRRHSYHGHQKSIAGRLVHSGSGSLDSAVWSTRET
jgi:hypothetical protein